MDDKDEPLDRIFWANGSRRTTKKVDMTRALFLLFKLEWPESGTTLEEAQILLLKHLGAEATRCAFLFGPIGLPTPFRWAPLCLSACLGTLLNGPGKIALTERGLIGEWVYKLVKLEAADVLPESDGDSYPSFMVGILGTYVNYMRFKTSGEEKVFATVYHNEADLSSWNRKVLILLGPEAGVEIDTMSEWSWYSLGIIDELSGDGKFIMHRVGSVFARLSRSRFLEEGNKCYGIMS